MILLTGEEDHSYLNTTTIILDLIMDIDIVLTFTMTLLIVLYHIINGIMSQ